MYVSFTQRESRNAGASVKEDLKTFVKYRQILRKMMNGCVISILSTLIIFTLLENCQANFILTVGARVAGDKLIQRKEFRINRLDPKALYTAKTYTGDNKSVITKVIINELKDSAYESSAIINGGPGRTFVTVLFEFNRAVFKDCIIEIYGKRTDS